VRRREKGLGIASLHVYHWLLRSYFSRESTVEVRFDCVELLQLRAHNLLKIARSPFSFESLHKYTEREKEEREKRS